MSLGWGNLTIPDSITIYAHNSYLLGNITNNGVIYLRNSQCQLLTGGGSVIYQNKTSQLQNDSNFASYNDTLFFTVSNTNELLADTSIINDTNIITDTGCFVIYGDSYGIQIDSYTVSYQVYFDTGLLAGTWGQSSLLSYPDIPRNRYIIKSGVNNFAINTIEVSFQRRK